MRPGARRPPCTANTGDVDERLREAGVISGYERLAEDIRVLRHALEETRETADSADGLVAATVDGHGKLVELWLDPRIYRAPDTTALAATISDTIAEAVRLAEEKVFAAVAKFLPADATAESADLRFDPFLHQLDRR